MVGGRVGLCCNYESYISARVQGARSRSRKRNKLEKLRQRAERAEAARVVCLVLRGRGRCAAPREKLQKSNKIEFHIVFALLYSPTLSSVPLRDVRENR